MPHSQEKNCVHRWNGGETFFYLVDESGEARIDRENFFLACEKCSLKHDEEEFFGEEERVFRSIHSTLALHFKKYLPEETDTLLDALEAAAQALREHRDEGTLPYVERVLREISQAGKKNIVLPRSLFENALREELDEEPTKEQVERFMELFEERLLEGGSHGGSEIRAYAEYLVEEWCETEEEPQKPILEDSRVPRAADGKSASPGHEREGKT